MAGQLSDQALDIIFREARTYNTFEDREVPDALLREVYDLWKYGPTSANCSPGRVLFVKSPEAKARLEPALDSGNRDKTMAAPVTAIVAYDTRFYEHLDKLFPHEPEARSWFEGKPNVEENAFRNGTLQGAYLIIACRAKGLDCGPMSGFDQGKVNAEFFPDGRFKSNFLCNIGYGTDEDLFERSPRFAFDEVCEIL